MKDRKEIIIEAGLTVFREHGYPGFSQPRVSAEAGIRQSHLTYYFPTRVDLMTAIAQTAINRQFGAIDMMLKGSSQEQVSNTMTSISVRYEMTRVLMALAQAADQEPNIRALFREFADGFVAHIGRMLENLGIKPAAEYCYFIHALSADLAVIDFATARLDGAKRATNVLQTTFALLASQSSADSDRAIYSKPKSTSKKSKKGQ